MAAASASMTTRCGRSLSFQSATSRSAIALIWHHLHCVTYTVRAAYEDYARLRLRRRSTTHDHPAALVTPDQPGDI